MMKRIVAAIAALSMGVFAAGASATAGTNVADLLKNPTGVVPNLSFTHVKPVLDDAGFETQIQTVSDERVLVVRAEGKNLILRESACSAGNGCGGLHIMAFLEDEQPLSVLNAFNSVTKPARASLVSNKVLLDRYLIADFGTTRGSLAVNIGVMAVTIDHWFNYVRSNGPIAVSFAPLMGELPKPGIASQADMNVIRALAADQTIRNADTKASGQLN